MTLAACGLAVGAGILLAGASPVASAAPADSNHSSVSAGSASSARTSSSLRTVKAADTNKSRTVAKAPAAAPVAAAVAQRRLPTLPSLPTPVAVIHAVQDAVTTLGRDLSRLTVKPTPTSANESSTATTPLRDPPAPGDVVYGNPLRNVRYFISQGDNNTCVLSSTAMVIGQLKGAGGMPTWSDIVQEAKDTPSYSSERNSGSVWSKLLKKYVARTGNIYDPVADEYVYYVDSMALMENHGVDATMTTFTKSQGDLALASLKSALTTNSVLVAVNNRIWAEAIGGAHSARRFGTANHAITVLGINETKDVIYINDSGGTGGQGLAVSLDGFMEAWQRGQYLSVSARLAAPSSQAALAA
ncbi:C39 family peptidase [Mycolicibacterium psychrotolerans]|uniref:C39 family peptidase n=1 Tax=Mycolicibacterium psychrotolerans TaxID=216929 RepID=UPI003D67C613